MTIEPGHRTFVRLPFTWFGLPEPLHILLGLRNPANDLLDVELSIRELTHPSLRARISASLERMPVHFSDHAIRVARARLLSRGNSRGERESCKSACNYTPHGKTSCDVFFQD